MTASDFLQIYTSKLCELYEEREAKNIFFMLLDHYLAWKKSDYLLKKNDTLSIESSQKLSSALQTLQDAVPVQYIIGKAYFYGRDFHVDNSVLIPRTETEELVHWILSENDHRPHSTLDIGTGSGVIALTLAAERDLWGLTALDISSQALQTAHKNADFIRVKAKFVQTDVLTVKAEDLDRKYDIVVSNPPYVTTSERAAMHQNVLENEPHLALFVPDEDPLLFYRKIAVLSLDILNGGGKLYFEINQAFGSQTVDMLTGLGYVQVALRKDLNGRDRMVRGIKAYDFVEQEVK